MNEATIKRVRERIESILEVNSAWREFISAYGILATVGWELDLEYNDAITSLADDLELTTEEVIEATRAYIETHRIWPRESIIEHIDHVRRILSENGSEDEVEEALAEYIG